MASFTDEEYADAARISRGYDRFLGTFVPYSLDPSCGGLNHIIMFRDRQNSVKDRPSPFKSIDGIVEVNSPNFPQQRNSTKIWEGLMGTSFVLQEDVSSSDLIVQLIKRSQEPDADGRAIMYLTHHADDSIACALGYHEGVITCFYKQDGYPKWQEATVECQFLPGGEFPEFLPDGVGHNAASRVKSILRNSEVFLERDGEFLSVEARYQMKTLMDRGIYRDEFLEEWSKTREQEEAPLIVKTMCLMMTDPRLEPNYEYTQNRPALETLETLVDVDHILQGNCVEKSTATALNFRGGIDGEPAHASYRVVPSNTALRATPARINLFDLDPLHHQSSGTQVFGSETRIDSEPLIDTIVSPEGTLVKVPGHQFYARLGSEGVEVYDSALRFCGAIDDYEKYLVLNGIPSRVLAVIETHEHDPERARFLEMCREPFMDADVLKRTLEIFHLKESKRSLDTLYSCWYEAIIEKPELLSSSMNKTGKSVEFQAVDRTELCERPISDKGIIEMIASQERGFICIEIFDKKNESTHVMIVIKDGENIFTCDGRDSDLTVEPQKCMTSISPGNSRQVTCFGGNDLNRMREIHSQGIETPQLGKAGDVVSR